MNKVDVSSYVHPEHEVDRAAAESGNAKPPKHDPTYSSLLGYGWGEPKLLSSNGEQRRGSD
jgi:hypothetical protein